MENSAVTISSIWILGLRAVSLLHGCRYPKYIIQTNKIKGERTTSMTALILALIALGTLFGLIVRAAKKAPQEYVDLMIMTEERHAQQNLEDIDE